MEVIIMTEIEKRRIALGKRITQRRQEINMTMDELAHLMGYKHRSSIQKLENGENGLPSDKVEELAGYLQMDPAELMGWIRLDAKNHGMTKLVQKALEQVMPSEEEFKLLNDMAMLNADGQELVLNFINSLLQNSKYREKEVDT
jgi:transcriptional regulator with XRE-family HTH domain